MKSSSLKTLFLNGCASIRRLQLAGQDCLEEADISGCHELSLATIHSRSMQSFTALHCESLLVSLAQGQHKLMTDEKTTYSAADKSFQCSSGPLKRSSLFHTSSPKGLPTGDSMHRLKVKACSLTSICSCPPPTLGQSRQVCARGAPPLPEHLTTQAHAQSLSPGDVGALAALQL